MKEILMGLARHLGGYLGAFLAAKGYIESSDVEMVVGAVVGLAVVGFSIVSKRMAAKKLKEVQNA